MPSEKTSSSNTRFCPSPCLYLLLEDQGHLCSFQKQVEETRKTPARTASVTVKEDVQGSWQGSSSGLMFLSLPHHSLIEGKIATDGAAASGERKPSGTQHRIFKSNIPQNCPKLKEGAMGLAHAGWGSAGYVAMQSQMSWPQTYKDHCPEFSQWKHKGNVKKNWGSSWVQQKSSKNNQWDWLKGVQPVGSFLKLRSIETRVFLWEKEK